MTGAGVSLLLTVLAQLFVGRAFFIDFDSASYDGIAQHLLTGQGYSLIDLEGVVRPAFHRTPGYPAFIAALCALWNAPAWVCATQAILGGATIASVGVLAATIWGSERVGKIAAWLQALMPGGIVMSSQLMTETLSNVTFVPAVALVILSIERKRLWLLWAAAFLIAASIYVRPTAMYTGPMLLVAALVAGPRTGRFWGISAAASILVALTLVPWMQRNERTSGHFVFELLGPLKLANDAANVMTEVEGVEHLPAMAQLGIRSGLKVEPTDGARFKERLKLEPDTLLAVSPYAKQYLKDHLSTFVWMKLRILPEAMVRPHTGRLFRAAYGYPSNPLPARGRLDTVIRWSSYGVEAPITALGWLLAVVGAYRALRARRHVCFVLLLGLVVGLLLAATGVDVLPRYRVPIEPWLWVLASAPLLACLDARRPHDCKSGLA
jgi:hypothetical protein